MFCSRTALVSSAASPEGRARGARRAADAAPAALSRRAGGAGRVYIIGDLAKQARQQRSPAAPRGQDSPSTVCAYVCVWQSDIGDISVKTAAAMRRDMCKHVLESAVTCARHAAAV